MSRDRPDRTAHYAARVVEHRHSTLRTVVVWDALQAELGELGGPGRVVDLGGGTGGFAVRVAELGHHVTVVDPSPDALAALDRRASEAGVAHRVRAVQGDATELAALVGDHPVDLVLCHSVLEVVDDPGDALDQIGSVLAPHGCLSVLVANRFAAVVARAVAGQLEAARDLLVDPSSGSGSVGGGGRRYARDEVVALLRSHGFAAHAVLAVRVFTDLVPSVVVDSEPDALDALLDLERSAAGRPEAVALAAQLHLLARPA